MNFNKYGRTAQLFDYQTMSDGLVGSFLNSDGTITTNVASSSWTITKYIPVAGQEFTLQRQASGGATSICLYDSNQTYITGLAYNGNGTVTVSANTDVSYIRFTYYRTENTGNIMLNEGSTAKPFEPYGNTWHDIPHYIHNTATDTITTLPIDLYADGTNATVGLKGNMSQTRTPSPGSPIQPSECGDLETEGAKAGQYKIPISSAGQTTPVYLGEVETTRKIRKLVLTGEESFFTDTSTIYNNTIYFGTRIGYTVFGTNRESLNSHFRTVPKGDNPQALNYECSGFNPSSSYSDYYYMRINLDTIGVSPSVSPSAATTAFKAWLAQQYAAGTPVCVWYVLATEETGIVNEPIRKIGDYADTVSGISIPTITGKDTFDVLTTLKPSEVSLTYTGWHDASVKEWDGSEWQ